MNEKNRPPQRQGMDYGETEDLQQVHAAIQREKREPRVGLEPLSIWLVAIYGIAIFWGGAYLGRFSGTFSGDSLGIGYEPAVATGPGGLGNNVATTELGPAERGKKVFTANCATCHQGSGLGIAGQYPPLAGSEYVMGGTQRLGMILLKGLQGPVTVKGAQYGSAVMQSWEKDLTDAKIADVLTYIRQEWGNNAPAVSADGIKALRKELAGHAGSFQEADLKAVPDDANLPGAEAAPAGAPPKPEGSNPPAGGAPPKP